ncbi:uncharacterized protein [Fopius arisanus]|uniref:Uncharacterized protein n=1 Tax=Fopius arisanus TaxID=64838 RepID=A0A9R1TQA5_9HYME|nr:PREDICTED: uncharacterized protein LOC105272780 [Fopius arisanus]XP_011313307.1 PREDICTED: uncharacterized protein LOC105272780 [Fopius arisanus]
MENPPLDIVHYCWMLTFCVTKKDIDEGLTHITSLVDENIASHPNLPVFLSLFKNQWQHRMDHITPPSEASIWSERSEALGRFVVAQMQKNNTLQKFIDSVHVLGNYELTRMNAFVNSDTKARRDRVFPLMVNYDQKQLQKYLQLRLTNKISIAELFRMTIRPALLSRLDIMIPGKSHTPHVLFEVNDIRSPSICVSETTYPPKLTFSGLKKRPAEGHGSVPPTSTVCEKTGVEGHVSKYFMKTSITSITISSNQHTSSQVGLAYAEHAVD